MTDTDALQLVLDEAHAGHVYTSDYAKHGIDEDWRAELIGDCDSFALWCRDRLRELDIESDLVLCKTETGEGHLVCSYQGWILDNRFKWVMNRDEMAYTWLKILRNGKWYIINR